MTNHPTSLSLRSLAVVMLSILGLTAYARPSAPIMVSASDLISKVYGVVSPSLTPRAMADSISDSIDMVPTEEDENLWLDSDEGYNLTYSDMAPETSAVACFDHDSLTNYAYFFIFPYDGSRNDANNRQTEFCGSLLQELYDLGLEMGLDSTPLAAEVTENGDTLSMTLFSVCARHGIDIIDITLQDQPDIDGGRFLVTLNVAPGGAGDNNIILASN